MNEMREWRSEGCVGMAYLGVTEGCGDGALRAEHGEDGCVGGDGGEGRKEDCR